MKDERPYENVCTQISVSLPVGLLIALDRFVGPESGKRSEFIRDAIRRELARQTGKAQ